MAPRRIHIVGASGSGTSTLGAALAERLSVPFVDVDDHYWRSDTAQPFTEKNAPQDRLQRIRTVLGNQQSWVLSGSLYTWGQDLIPAFTLVVFLQLDPSVRMARLRAREHARFGVRIQEGGDRYAHAQAFFAWAAEYDVTQAHARTLFRHQAWLATLACPVLRLDSHESVDVLVTQVLAYLR